MLHVLTENDYGNSMAIWLYGFQLQNWGGQTRTAINVIESRVLQNASKNMSPGGKCDILNLIYVIYMKNTY